MTESTQSARRISLRALLMGFLGFITIPVLLLVWIFGTAYFGIRPVRPVVPEMSFESHSDVDTWFDNGYVDYGSSGQEQKIRPFVGQRAVLTGIQWRYGGQHRSTQEVLDDIRRRSAKGREDRLDHVVLTCLNAAEYEEAQAEIWIQAFGEGEEDFNALPKNDLNVAQRALPGPELPTLRDYRACGVMVGLINEIIDEEGQE